jgi:hypothetical protein
MFDELEVGIDSSVKHNCASSFGLFFVSTITGMQLSVVL